MTAGPIAGTARLLPMRPRDPQEPHRTASPLELFFDLVFVVAVSIVAVELHHAIVEGHVVDGLLSFLLVFAAMWWAWMNFTWFATSFATDDWLYRLLTIVQMVGVLVLAAGIAPVFAEGDLRLLVAGYVVMRVGVVAQWLRASLGAGERARTARLYAIGITIVQVLWLLMLLAPASARPFIVVALLACELTIPFVAERFGAATPWHAHHITERYGLFTLILLGESLLASSNAIIEALHGEAELMPLLGIAAITIIVTAALWWLYFWPEHHELIGSMGATFRYGYGHYFVFAAAAAFSAGIEVEIDVLTGHAELSPVAASFAVTVPIAVFVLAIWWIAIRPVGDRVVNFAVPAIGVLVLLDPIIPIPIALTAAFMVVLVVVLVLRQPSAERALH